MKLAKIPCAVSQPATQSTQTQAMVSGGSSYQPRNIVFGDDDINLG
jgi:hypothetical protein